MRIQIPEFSTKKETFDYLIKNKKQLISKKRMGVLKSDPFLYSPTFLPDYEKGLLSAKSGEGNQDQNQNPDKIRVKLVANTANWIDSHMDMLIPGSAAKSINERKGIIPHLYDHKHSVLSEVGDVVDIYAQNISLRELGINKDGNTEAIIFISDVRKDYNEIVFNRYKSGKATQHSIGIQYVKIELAINDKDYEKEYDFYKKYYDLAINKEVADEYGFFWVIQEYKLIENSVVLFGANEITPTLEIEGEGEKSIEPFNGHSTETKSSIVKLANLIKN